MIRLIQQPIWVTLPLAWDLVVAYWVAFAIQLATHGSIWPKYSIAVVCVAVNALMVVGVIRESKAG